MLKLLAWFARWPLWLLHLLGAAVGWVAYAGSASYRRRFREQARRAGVPAAVARRAVAQSGCLVTELPRLWLGRGATAGDLSVPVEWRGEEHLAAALATGRGVLLLTPHLGCFEVTAQAYARRHGRDAPITVMYRPARQAWLQALQARSRERPGMSAVPASLAGVRQMVRALRRGEAVGLLPDQVPPEGLGVWAPFFGQPAYTMTLAARLAAQTGATLLLAWGERLPRGMGYRVHLMPCPQADAIAQAPPEQAARLVNEAMEGLVRACPQQYLWGYDRHRPPRGAAAGAPVGPVGPVEVSEAPEGRSTPR